MHIHMYITHYTQLNTRLSDYCLRNDIKLHMDGARFWEAVAYYGDKSNQYNISNSSSNSRNGQSTSVLSGSSGNGSESKANRGVDENTNTHTTTTSSSTDNSKKWVNPSRESAILLASLFDSVYVSFYKVCV